MFFRWFRAVNIAITFMIDDILGWIACNILKPLIMAFCSAGSVSSVEVHVSFLFSLHICTTEISNGLY